MQLKLMWRSAMFALFAVVVQVKVSIIFIQLIN